MNYIRSTASFTIATILSISILMGQDEYFQTETGLPGDHLSLAAVLDLFKEAKSLESFEKLLNQEDNKVNNLDLDQDGQVDYIRVQDFVEDNAHAIVLQVPLDEKQAQDIAVIEIESTKDGEAILQIIGDEDIYGEAWIVEPFNEVDNGRGPNFEEDKVRLVVNVWAWPTVRFVYRPNYVAWVSPWRFHHYPRWWSPWRPSAWTVYFGHHHHHHRHFHAVPTHRVFHAHRVYTPRRRASLSVQRRHQTNIKTYRANPKVSQRSAVRTTKTIERTGPAGGKVTATKSTTVAGARGKQGQDAIGKKSKTTVTAQGPRGNQAAVEKNTAQGAAKDRNHAAAGKKTTVRKQVKGADGASASSKKTTKAGVHRSPGTTTAASSKSKTVKVKGKKGARAGKKTTKKKTTKRRR